MSGTETDIRVLHVDDEPEFGETAASFLEREDGRFDTEVASRVDRALEYLAAQPVDCIVSDYDMPGRNGIEFLRTVRQEHPDLPFILYTGKGSEEVAAEAISAGVTDYLQKDSGTSQYTVLANRIRNAVSAHRSAAEAERRRHRLEQILKTVPGCVVQLDTDGQFVFANERAEQVLGLKREAVTDRTYNDPDWDIRDLNGNPIPDEELPFRRVRDSGEPVYGVKHTIQWPDGTRKVLLVSGAPLFDDDGAVDSVVFSLTDITDQQEREQELAKTQRRLRLALETTGTGVWEWDIETDEVVWSDSLERVMGLDPGEFEGSFGAFADRVHPDDLSRVREQVEHAIETGSVYQTEFRMQHTDGSYRWVEVRGQLVEDEAGARMVGIHHDITDRKERERQLEAMERRLEAILANTTTPMFMKNAEGEYIFVNRGYRELFDLQDADIVGRTDHDIHPPEMAAEVQRNDRQVLDSGNPVETEERIIVDGEERQFLTSKVPIYDTGEQVDPDTPVAVFGVATEITERKQQEQTLRAQNERLDQFASVVSHDLRNPLRIADGRLELAREEFDGDSEHLESIGSALDRMDRIIEDVLWLAREGQDIGDTHPVDLRERIEAAWSIAAGDYANADLVGTDDDTEGFGRVTADADRLQQLLENLFRNAVEHGGTAVTVRVGRTDGGFYVADDGPGVPDSVRADIFEPGSTTADRGTGLGLTIVSQIVEAHDWELRVTDSADGGARFEITGVEFAE